MAQFHVGQRVKRIKTGPGEVNGFLLHSAPLGAEGVVVSIDGDGDCDVKFDAEPCALTCYRWTLAPLTDPAADAFLERMKKLGREPLVPVTTERGTALFPK
jgi:hypothetical protein